MTVNEVSKRTGISVRTLQYYDQIGLLCPAAHTSAHYRLYDDAALEKLQQILLFRELEFPLKQIKAILSSPNFDRSKALEQQIALLTLKKERLENLIAFARGIKMIGGHTMDFSVFDSSKLDEYAQQAKEQWGKTDAYKEYERKSQGRSSTDERALVLRMMQIFAAFGQVKNVSPASAEAQALVKTLQSYITENFYRCTPDILSSLGAMYAAGGEFTENIDSAGGEGTAQFVADAIHIYCR